MRMKRCMALLLVCFMFAGMGTALAAGATKSDIKVMVNGKYLQNADVYNRDGSVLVPFRVILESLGAKVSYEEATRTVTAELRDRKISFKTDSKTIHIDADGIASDLEMDAPAANIGGKTMVPVRVMSKALGLSVSWDNDDRAVVIIDFEAMLSNIDAKYTVLNRLMQVSTDPSKTYNIANTSKNVSVTSDETTGKLQKMTMTQDLKIDMLMRGGNINMVYDFSMNTEYEGFPEDEIAQNSAILDAMKNVKITILYDSDSECLYANLGSLGKMLTGMAAEGDIWFSFDATEYIDMSGYADEIRAILAGDTSNITFGMLLMLVLNRSDIYSIDSYDTLRFGLDVSYELLSDKAFTIRGTQEKPEYSYTLNLKKIQKAIVTAGMKSVSSIKEMAEVVSTMDMKELGEFELTCKYVIGADYDYRMTGDLKLRFDSIEAASILGSYADEPDIDDLHLVMNMKFDKSFPGKSSATADMRMKMDGVEATANTTASGETTIVTTEFVTVPPADATVIDVVQLISGMFSGG